MDRRDAERLLELLSEVIKEDRADEETLDLVRRLSQRVFGAVLRSKLDGFCIGEPPA